MLSEICSWDWLPTETYRTFMWICRGQRYPLMPYRCSRTLWTESRMLPGLTSRVSWKDQAPVNIQWNVVWHIHILSVKIKDDLFVCQLIFQINVLWYLKLITKDLDQTLIYKIDNLKQQQSALLVKKKKI